VKKRPTILVAYLASLIAGIAAVYWICSMGRSLVAGDWMAASHPFTAPLEKVDALPHVLLAVVVVILAARAAGAIFKKFHQPPVIGEIIAGILLGPSFLGQFAPDVTSYLFPSTVVPHLGVISQIGIIFYMFLIGLELDTSLLRQRTGASIAISHTSIIVPFVSGTALALLLYPLFSQRNISFTVFALFIGVAMSITAFPVLARILTDLNMQKSRLGVLAIGCAAIDDVSAWCLLALVVSLVRAQPGRILLTLALTAGFIVFVLLIGRRIGLWLARRPQAVGQTTRDMFAVIGVGLLLAALATEQIGIHAIFGAFLFGTVIPHDSALARDVREKLEDFVVVLLLPVFFAFTGTRTRISLLQEPHDWLLCLLIIVVASVGKFGGSYVAARFTGSDWREAAALGILLNTRGLMELVVLNVGLDLGVLSPTLFTMLVIMAVTTTIATTPILQAFTTKSGQLSDMPAS
jgi:Kef-type K+ transport system membrane component KefB